MTLLLLFLCLVVLDTLSYRSVKVVTDDAHVINFLGTIRGTGQRLVKLEMMGEDTKALVTKVDGYFEELFNPNGVCEHFLQKDKIGGHSYDELRQSLKKQWLELREAIRRHDTEDNPNELLLLSEEFWISSDRLVDEAEELSRKKVADILALRAVTFFVFLVLSTLSLAQFFDIFKLMKNNAFLTEKALVDQMTALPNRWACDLRIERYKRHLPPNLLCFMADLNNLKTLNDTRGHLVGDNLIKAFGCILKETSEPYGFVGRNGGDEFLGFFEGVNQEQAHAFKKELRRRVEEHNTENPDVQISFACGMVHSSEMSWGNVHDVMSLADQRMYADKTAQKRRMKQHEERMQAS